MVGPQITRIERNTSGGWVDASLFLGAVPANDGAWDYAAALSLPAPGDYRATVVETWAGYDNSPRTSVIAFRVGPPAPRTGTIAAPVERTLALDKVQTEQLVFRQTADPDDNTDWCVNFASLLEPGETIASLRHINTNPEAEALGITVDVGAKRPIIDTDRLKVGWMLVGDPDFSTDVRFGGAGVLVGTNIEIATNAVPPRIYQRTLYTRIIQR